MAGEVHDLVEQLALVVAGATRVLVIDGDRSEDGAARGGADRDGPHRGDAVGKRFVAVRRQAGVGRNVLDDDRLTANDRGPRCAGSRAERHRADDAWKAVRHTRRGRAPQTDPRFVDEVDGRAGAGNVFLHRAAESLECLGQWAALRDELQDLRLRREILLGPLALGDVATDRLVFGDLTALVVDWSGRPVRPTHLAVGLHRPMLGRDAAAAAAVLHGVENHLDVTHVEQLGDVDPDELLGLTADGTGERVVHERVAALAVGPGDELGLILDDGAVTRLTRADSLLGLASLRDVACRDDDPADGRIVEQVHRNRLDMTPLPVGAAQTELHRLALGGRSREGRGKAFEHAIPVVGVHVDELVDLPDIVSAAEDLQTRRAGIRDVPVRVDDGDDVRQVQDQRAEALLTLSQRFLGLPSGRDVARGHDEALDRRVVEQIVADDLDDAPRSVGVPDANLRLR